MALLEVVVKEYILSEMGAMPTSVPSTTEALPLLLQFEMFLYLVVSVGCVCVALVSVLSSACRARTPEQFTVLLAGGSHAEKILPTEYTVSPTFFVVISTNQVAGGAK